jgi:hypothetical protein
MTNLSDLGTQARIASGINVLVGHLLVATPLLYSTDTPLDISVTVNNVVVGILIVIFAALRLFWPHRNPGFSGANIAFGFWALVSPWVYGYSVDTPHAALSAIIGVAIIVLGTWSGSATLREQRQRPA